MKKTLFFTLVFCLLTLVFLSKTIGIYFEHYEATLNAVLSGEFAGTFTHADFYSTFFGYFSLVSFLSMKFQSANIYSWLFILLTSINFSILFAYLQEYLKRKELSKLWHYTILMLCFVLYFDCIFYQNNLRIAFVFIVAIHLLYSFMLERQVSKKYLVILIPFLMAGIFIRIEIALISALVAVMFVFLFQKRLLPFSLAVFALVLLVGVVFSLIQSNSYERISAYMQVEKEFEDRYSVDFESLTKEDQIKAGAIRRFIVDEPVFAYVEFTDFLETRSFKSYILGSGFKDTYLSKLEDLRFDLKPYKFLIACFFLLLIGTVYFSRQYRFRILLYSLVLLSSPFLLNLFLSCPYNLLVVEMILGSIFMLVHLASLVGEQKQIKIFLGIFIALVVSTQYVEVKQRLNWEQENYQKEISLRNILQQYSDEGKIPVVGDLLGYEYYPSRLFSDLYDVRINHYYLNFYLFSDQEFFKKRTATLFPSMEEAFSKRVLACVNNEAVVFIAMDYHIAFMRDYLSQFHGLTLRAEPLGEDNGPDEIKAFQLILEQ